MGATKHVVIRDGQTLETSRLDDVTRRLRKRQTRKKLVSQSTRDFQNLCELLMGFAEKELRAHREFYPFAASVASRSGEVGAVATWDGSDHPSAKTVFTELRTVLTHEAFKGKIRAAGLAYKATIANADGITSDAVIIDLDHRDGSSLAVVVPYHFFGDDLHVAPSFHKPGKHHIFH